MGGKGSFLGEFCEGWLVNQNLCNRVTLHHFQNSTSFCDVTFGLGIFGPPSTPLLSSNHNARAVLLQWGGGVVTPWNPVLPYCGYIYYKYSSTLVDFLIVHSINSQFNFLQNHCLVILAHKVYIGHCVSFLLLGRHWRSKTKACGKKAVGEASFFQQRKWRASREKTVRIFSPTDDSVCCHICTFLCVVPSTIFSAHVAGKWSALQ